MSVDTAIPDTMQTRLKEFVRLEHERRELEERLEACKKAADTVQKVLIDEFADTGLQNAKVDGLTVYVRTDRFVSKKADFSTQQICDTLRGCGLGYMVADGYNAASLKSKIVEFIKDEIEVPAELAEKLNIGETMKLATRKS